MRARRAITSPAARGCGVTTHGQPAGGRRTPATPPKGQEAMAVKMRLRREGKRKQPFYRVVIADVRSPRDGRFVEDIGYYHPIREPSDINIDRDRALYWLRNGAQPTQAVTNLLRIEGIWQEFKPDDADEHAERRKRRAEKRERKHAAQSASRKAAAEEQRKAEEDKAAADAEALEDASEAGEPAEASSESAAPTDEATDESAAPTDESAAPRDESAAPRDEGAAADEGSTNAEAAADPDAEASPEEEGKAE
jgi:small subunit ribosomal protein S16